MMQEYVTLHIVRERIEETRRQAEQRRALRTAPPPRRPLRVRLGLRLVRLGCKLARPVLPPGASITLADTLG